MRRIFDNVVSLGIIVIIILIVVQLPTWLLDFLLILNISISLLILLISMYIKDALEFSIFPSLLLVTTVFRIALTVSSTRLILGAGGYAGEVIRTFGEFVIGGQPIVGFIIFIVILIIQYLVIVKGSERVAEVSARFTLDAMPGKQMAIDADLNTGAINEAQARERREKISREAEFYGAMDGATKFVKGDAIVQLIVFFINIIGGIIIGMVTMNLDISDIMAIYTIASVGDGLVSQIPALMISMATGMVVTRAASESSLSKDIVNQFSRMPVTLIITGIGVLSFSLLLGFGMGLFLGALFLSLGLIQWRNQNKVTKQLAAVPEVSDIEEPLVTETDFYKDPRNIYEDIEVYLISVEFGYSLLPLIEEKGSNFDDRFTNFKRQFAADMGVVIPEVTFLDNLRITPNSYTIKIKDEQVATGEILPGHYLIMDSSGMFGDIDGIDTVEPAFGFPAKWIPGSSVERAEILGYSVIDPQSVILTHLCDVIKNHAYEFIGRAEVEQLLENVRRRNASLVEEVIGNIISVTAFQKILVNLLREHIPVKDLTTIIETVAEHAAAAAGGAIDVDILTEYCRQALKRTITRIYAEEGALNVVMLDMELENAVLKGINKTAAGVYIMLEPNVINNVLTSLMENIAKLDELGYPRIIMTSPVVRIYFKQFIEQYVPDLIVLSSSEIDTRTKIQVFGTVKSDAAA